ncbi:uncharacterized protein LOC127839338 isoform X2 [Dreissena polymorpha]|nr:uncharacterized protein LOC127839338 isoform X2 [Dreissena polymorpha]
MAEGGIDRTMSETESVPRSNSLYSCNSRNYVESVSMEMCTILNRLGYGEEIRRRRIEKYKERDRLRNARTSRLTTITSGSKAEGLTCYFESDWDFLFVLNDVICVEAGINLPTLQEDMDVYRMDTLVYPGYCSLFLERLSRSPSRFIINSLCENGYGGILLCSGLFLDEFSTFWASTKTQSPIEIVHHERAGPSIPETLKMIKGINGELNQDHVLALRCHCPSILERWAARHRHWPPPVIVQRVVSFGAYVTPVGLKGSERKNIDWRICFDTGETELVNNLNDTQAKVYVLLKFILKDVLRPRKKEITSYVIKNIVLWQAERNPQNKFSARSLVHWLHDGLGELRTAIETQQLSYYMIPDRNLMAANSFSEKQQSKWVADITDLMAEGPRLILRLPKIRHAIIASPEPMLWFNKIRTLLEIVWQEMANRIEQYGDFDVSDIIQQEIIRLQLQTHIVLHKRMLEEGFNGDIGDIVIRILL